MPSAVTLAEIAALIRAEMEGKYRQTERHEGRRRLLDVVEQLAAAEPAGSGDPLLDGRGWRLSEARITGLGGIGALDPPALAFTPVAGVTVVRGPNGHGKTSLARGIDCGLRGESDRPEAAGRLWEPGLVTEGSDRATVEVTLVGGGDRLILTAEFPAAGTPTVAAVLTDAAGARQVAVGEAWRHALRAAHVCFSYGALQSRLTDDTELQSYLEELLILGPAWQQVRDGISARSDEAGAAARAVESARKTAIRKEGDLAQRFEADERAPARPPDVAWPRAKDRVDVDAWLGSTGLGQVTVPDTVRVGADHEDRIVRLDRLLRDADEALAEAETTLDSPGMAAAMAHVDRIVEVTGLDPETCPVCGARSDWRAHARDVVAGVRGRAAAATDVQRAVTELAQWVESELVALLAVDVPGGPVDEVSAFRQASTGGHHAHSPAHRAAYPLLEALASDAHRDWLARLRATSDATAEWRAALSAVAHEFAAVLRTHGATAVDAGAWKKADETLDAVQAGLRQQRQDTVTAQMHAALRRMLPDAEIELTAITHPGGVKRQGAVRVGLTIGGRRARLGMLSSGQRNALLLTPLVGLEDPGPFGFLVVDDPAHALDDLRIDLLAQELARLGRRRQVVVMTHDPRLEEHLRARQPDMTVVELSRDAGTATVTCTSHTTPWGALLDDATELCDHPPADGVTGTESVDSVVAGLCRAAVDGAIRQAAITRAVRSGENPDDALDTLGEERTTRHRIEHVTALAGGAARLPCLDRGRREHLAFWNKGSHGQLPAGVDLRATVAAAADACAELTTFDWPTT